MCTYSFSIICVFMKTNFFSHEFLKPLAYRNIMDAQFYRFSFIFNSGLFIFYWSTYFMTLKPWTKSNSCLSCVSSACDKYKQTNHSRQDYGCTKIMGGKLPIFNYLYIFKLTWFPDYIFFPLLLDMHTRLEDD